MVILRRLIADLQFERQRQPHRNAIPRDVKFQFSSSQLQLLKSLRHFFDQEFQNHHHGSAIG